ncbi:hypothetical protein HY839_00050 [Candidatus Azambacteria bacterium]|nr:hypothetical protein [Candidatus Azambacteria bacterium]
MMKSKVKSQKSKVGESGVTIYLAMLMLSAALTTAIFVSTVFVREFKISKEVADSLKAVYAADTAMEYTLYQARVDTTFSSFDVIAANDHVQLPTGSCEAPIFSTNMANKKCQVDAYLHVLKGAAGIPGCPASSLALDCTRIITKGSYGATNRAIEIVYENL